MGFFLGTYSFIILKYYASNVSRTVENTQPGFCSRFGGQFSVWQTKELELATPLDLWPARNDQIFFFFSFFSAVFGLTDGMFIEDWV